MRPVPGRVTQPYWEFNESYPGHRHRGIDYAAPLGTPVRAPWSGTVTSAEWGPAYGTHLVVDFDKLPDGSPGYWGVLAHLSTRSVVPGQRVAAGQVVGLSGSTGASTGPHLHFEVQSGPVWRPASHVPEVSRNPQPWIEATVAPPAYRNIKIDTPQTITLNGWTTLDLGPQDFIVPPVGSNDWWVQVHLSLASATVPRNDLRYVKGRWARKQPDSPDANADGLNTHGTDTAAISADIPKDSWQSSFSTDMKGLEGVPVAFQVYIGAMKSGTIVSPMRLFTVDDETT